MRNAQKLLLLAVLCAGTCLADSVYIVNANSQFGTVDLGTGAFQQIGPNMPEVSTGLTLGSGLIIYSQNATIEARKTAAINV